MSRQRPYGTFEEAYILLLINHNKGLFDIFMKACTDAKQFCDKDYNSIMKLPAIFLINPRELYIPFWQCLCRMYGEMFENPEDSFIYGENLNLMIDDLKYWYYAVCYDCIYSSDISYIK